MPHFNGPGPAGTYLVQPGILAKGYEITGDLRSGLHATVPYLVKWEDAVNFAAACIQAPTATHIGGITWTPPYRLPLTIQGVQPPLYANRVKIAPCGAKGDPLGPASTYGINPGEYFTWAKVTVDFDNVLFLQGVSDDTGGLNQLDPVNPIIGCEQSVKMIGQMITVDGSAYTYQSGSFSGKPVKGQVGFPRNEVKLVLRFPRVPYLPWQTMEPYCGKVNESTFLNCVKGSLLLESPDTTVVPSIQGINQGVTLSFAFKPDWTGESGQGLDWNSEDFPDGSGTALIAGVGGQMRFAYTDFSALLVALEF